MPRTKCRSCGRLVPGYNIILIASDGKPDRALCSRCSNQEIAEAFGLTSFVHPAFDPIKVTDCDGDSHTFHFNARLFGPGIALDAFELRRGYPAGYEFQVIGDPQGDPMDLFTRLLKKIRTALAIKHLSQGDFGLQIADHQIVRATITTAPGSPHLPALVIDGREVSWAEFGHMLTTYAGWQCKLEIRDKSEDL